MRKQSDALCFKSIFLKVKKYYYTLLVHLHYQYIITHLKFMYNIFMYNIYICIYIELHVEELHVILASDDGHKKLFPDVPMIDFKINKNLKTHLVRSQLPDLDEVGRSKPCVGKRPCHLCENMKHTCTFKSKHLNEVHKINKEYNCSSKMAVYLTECEIYGEQYTDSTKTNLGSRANNYKSTQRKFVNKEAVPKQTLKQKRFYEHYCSDRHNDI